MRKTGWLLAFLATLAVAAWAQQPGPATGSGQIHVPVIAKSHPASGPAVSAPTPCPAAFYDSLKTDGIVGTDHDGVTLPKALFRPEAQLSEEARTYIQQQHIRNFKASAQFIVVIDSKGSTQNPCLLKSAGYGLDVQAEKAVQQYKFAPATKDGKPVPIRIVVELKFKTY